MPTRMLFGAGPVHFTRQELERMKRHGWVETFPAPVEYVAKKFNQPKPFTEDRLETIRTLYRLAKSK